MNKSFAILLLAIVFAACSGGSSKVSIKPYKFDRDKLDKMVKSKTALYDATKRKDGTLESVTYYLIDPAHNGDTARFRLEYDNKSNINKVLRYNAHGQIIWQEMYHPNGQRRSLYKLKAFENVGPKSLFHGIYEEYYPDGRLKAIGEYNKDNLMWSLEYDKEGVAGDTTLYDYAEDMPVSDTPAVKKSPKVEKINTATTTN